jgi:putative transposase
VTAPRRIRPGTTWFVTRRCNDRSFYLRPDAFVGQLLLYVLGFTAGLFGLEIHAVCAMSSHWHLIVTDHSGIVCRFFERAHALIARAMNCCRGRWGSFWEPGRLSLVELVTPDTILDKLIYVISNPIAEDLVAQARAWPGLITLPVDIVGQRTYRTQRPDKFFSSLGIMPASTSFRLTRPPGFDHLTDDELLGLVEDRLAKRELEHRNRRRREGRQVLGGWRVKKTPWTNRASSPERRRVRNPHLSCLDPARRVQELGALQRFRAEYRVARRNFETGRRRTLFPHGTYLLHRRYRVRCRDPVPCD